VSGLVERHVRVRPPRAPRGVVDRRSVRQLTFRSPGQLEWEEVATPRLSADIDALVRPIAVATCDLDAAVVAGRAPLPGPFAFGHEFVAEVVEVAHGVERARRGDRVIVPFQISCGVCERCRRGLTASCVTAGAGAAFGMAPIARREWGGALSDVVRVPFADAMLVPLPPDVEAATFASVSDNVPDGWRAVAPALASDPEAPVLIVGGGGDVALYAAAVAVALGSPQVDYVDTNERRLQVAEAVGANPVERAADGKRLGRYRITVDHSGELTGLHSAIRSTEPEGTCTSTAIYFGSDTPLPLLDMYTRGITFRTGRVNARTVLPRVVDLIVDGRLRPELVTAATVPWVEADKALAGLNAKTVVVR
jgi:threonine dehydrogenase-like Zn-dependent dehydrogenase